MICEVTSVCRAARRACAAASLLVLAACGSTEADVALGLGLTTLVGGQMPSNEIEQIYYLGVFDAREQIPPMIYRVRVHGQASALNGTQFASGWVPAQIADSLGANISFQPNGDLSITPAGTNQAASLVEGRKLIAFGPEGFRTAPDGQRLVIAMGSDASAYFTAVDNTLGAIGTAMQEKRNLPLLGDLAKTMIRLESQEDRLSDVKSQIDFVNTLQLGAGQ